MHLCCTNGEDEEEHKAQQCFENNDNADFDFQEFWFDDILEGDEQPDHLRLQNSRDSEDAYEPFHSYTHYIQDGSKGNNYILMISAFLHIKAYILTMIIMTVKGTKMRVLLLLFTSTLKEYLQYLQLPLKNQSSTPSQIQDQDLITNSSQGW